VLSTSVLSISSALRELACNMIASLQVCKCRISIFIHVKDKDTQLSIIYACCWNKWPQYKECHKWGPNFEGVGEACEQELGNSQQPRD
jgi:hypothetical protein